MISKGFPFSFAKFCYFIFFGGENFNISENSIISVEVGILFLRKKLRCKKFFENFQKIKKLVKFSLEKNLNFYFYFLSIKRPEPCGWGKSFE
jgi:hypothetical protein